MKTYKYFAFFLMLGVCFSGIGPATGEDQKKPLVKLPKSGSAESTKNNNNPNKSTTGNSSIKTKSMKNLNKPKIAPEHLQSSDILKNAITLKPSRAEQAERIRQNDLRSARISHPGDLENYLNQYRNKYDDYIYAEEIYHAKVVQCSSKSYSVSDQRQAGCTTTDTFDQCSTKLLNKCSERQKYGYNAALEAVRSTMVVIKHSAKVTLTAIERDKQL